MKKKLHLVTDSKYSSLLAVLFLLILIGLLYFPTLSKKTTAQTVEPDIKVAFYGDSAVGSNSDAVMTMVKNENVAFVVDSGDLDYKNNPQLWDDHVKKYFGTTYPYLVSEGNHESSQWPGYSQKIAARQQGVPGLACTGEVGVKQTCVYKGITVLLTAPNINGTGHDAYITQQLAAATTKWKICSWHELMSGASVGGGNEVGWPVYEACRKGGAIIATAHLHYYARTKTLIDITNQTVDPNCNLPQQVCVALGKTFLFISGLGGFGFSGQSRCLPATPPYGCKGEWASIYTNKTFGALFIIFNYKGDPNKAHGYFKTIKGEIIDEFDITLGDTASPPSAPAAGAPIAAPSVVPSINAPIFNCLGSCPTVVPAATNPLLPTTPQAPLVPSAGPPAATSQSPNPAFQLDPSIPGSFTNPGRHNSMQNGIIRQFMQLLLQLIRMLFEMLVSR